MPVKAIKMNTGKYTKGSLHLSDGFYYLSSGQLQELKFELQSELPLQHDAL